MVEEQIMVAEQDILLRFRTAMVKAGLFMKAPIVTDGRLHRFHVEGDKPSTKNGWYVLFDGNIPAGVFGSWKHGVSQNWCARDVKILSRRDKKAFHARMKQASMEQRLEQDERHKQARIKAQLIWDKAGVL